MSPEDPRHGIEAGVMAHRRAGQRPCGPCREAHRRNNIVRQLYPSKCLAIGSQRRIRALQAIGYSRDRIAAEVGYTDAGALNYLMNAETMLRTTAQKIADAYDRLVDTIPEGQGASRARTWARRHGHHPPSAWFGVDIDDPAAEPDPGWSPKRKPIEVTLEDFDWLVRQGESEDRAAERLGVKLHSIRDMRRRIEREAS